MNTPQRLTRLMASVAALASLAACSANPDEAPTNPPPPPPAGSITLTGVVARGAALANASVAVTCATGTGTATTSATGAYSVAITGGALPCVLRATSSDASLRLHSVAPPSTASSVTSNITPLTELVVARLTGAEPAAYVSGVSAGTLAGTITATAVTAAQVSVAGTLTAGGVNTAAAGDFISAPLVAAAPGATPNAHDQVLDALSAQLSTAGTTLSALTTAIANGSPAAPPPSPSTAEPVSLPPELLVKPKAATCAWLPSARYRLIKTAPSTGSTVTALELLDFNATTLTFTSVSNPADSFALTPNGNCRFRLANGPAADLDLVVAPSGVLVVRALIGADDDTVAVAARGTTRLIVALPVQDIPVASLAGTWNYIGWERSGSATAFAETGVIATVASSGAITGVKCSSLLTPESSCTTEAGPFATFSANSAGGFNLTSNDPSDPYVERAFFYRAGNGELMGVTLDASQGSIGFITKVRTLSLPAVGAVSTAWNLDLSTGGLASSALYYRTNTVVSVDTVAGSLVRNTANDGSTVTVPQTIQYNKARAGHTYRPGANVTNSAGSPATVREVYSLPLSGFGVTPYYLLPNSTAPAALFGLSVTRQP